MPSGLMWSKDNHLNEFKEYTYENICFYLTITWYAVSFKTKYLKVLVYLFSDESGKILIYSFRGDFAAVLAKS